MLFYIQSLLILIWVAVGSLIALIHAVLRWGHLNNNRFSGLTMAYGMLPIMGVKVTIDRPDRRDNHQPCVYVANHQSGLDVAIFGAITPHKIIIIGKKEIRYMPFFGVMFAASGNVMIDRSNRSSAFAHLKEVVRALQVRGASIFVFPEGTRNHHGTKIHKFKKGAFFMAIEAQVPIVPLVAPPLEHFFDRKRRRFIPGKMVVRALEPIPTQGLKSDQVEELMEKTHAAMQAAIDEAVAEHAKGLAHQTRKPVRA